MKPDNEMEAKVLENIRRIKKTERMLVLVYIQGLADASAAREREREPEKTA